MDGLFSFRAIQLTDKFDCVTAPTFTRMHYRPRACPSQLLCLHRTTNLDTMSIESLVRQSKRTEGNVL